MNFKEMTFKEAIQECLDLQQGDKLKKRIFGQLDLEIIECDEETRKWADFRYEAKEEHLNPYDGVHGGVACVIADSCMGSAICALTQGLPSTTEMSESYLTPMPMGSYRIHVEIKKAGNSLVSTVCDIINEDGGFVCVTFMARYIIVKKDILADEKSSAVMKEQK